MTLTTAPNRAVPQGIGSAGAQSGTDVLAGLGVEVDAGLSDAEVLQRRRQWGPNAVSSHHARLWPVLWHQLRSPLLALLFTAAVASYFVGERSDALIIGVILVLSVGLGFVNEYRAEKAAEALHDQIHHETVVLRNGRSSSVDVTELVPGDVVILRLGDVVPADLRLLSVAGLGCDESVLTGESLPVDKHTDPVPVKTPLADVLADGVTEGRRIFANTIKYVLMGTSSNFGNMFSAAGASLFLSFLPMLPSQILLNNLLYDSSQLAIPTDNVDEEQLRRPSHWDIGFIRRFMIFFGPLSSVFDFVTFGVMLWIFHAGAAEFRSGWFVESLATQTLVIFAIRTRHIPFFRSHPSLALTLAALGVVAVGSVLPATPLAHTLGFSPLPVAFFAALAGMVVSYLILIEAGKRIFYRTADTQPASTSSRQPSVSHHLRRRAARFSTGAD